MNYLCNYLVIILFSCVISVFCNAELNSTVNSTESATTVTSTVSTVTSTVTTVINYINSSLDNLPRVEKETCIQSPTDVSGYWQTENYPEPYLQKNLSCRIEFVEGFFIKITIEDFDIDSSANDYVVIIPGESLDNTGKGIILAWNVKKREYIIPSNIVDMTFKTFKENQNYTGFSIKWERYGELTSSTEPPTTTTSLPTPGPNDDSMYVAYLANTNPKDLASKVDILKKLLVNKAETYCKEKNIVLTQSITVSNVNISLIISCYYLWPNADTCVELHIAIPAFVKDAKSYELNKLHLEQIWNSITDTDLSVGKWVKYAVPDDDFTLNIWLVVIGVIICVFIAFLVFIRYVGMKFIYDKDKSDDLQDFNIHSARQSDVSLRPTQIITTPPIFDTGEDYAYPNISYRNYSATYNNPCYQNDDDESDDEILNITNIPRKNDENFASFLDYNKRNKEPTT